MKTETFGSFRTKLNYLGKDIDAQCPSFGIPEPLQTAEYIIINCTTIEPLTAKLLKETGLCVLTENFLKI